MPGATVSKIHQRAAAGLCPAHTLAGNLREHGLESDHSRVPGIKRQLINRTTTKMQLACLFFFRELTNPDTPKSDDAATMPHVVRCLKLMAVQRLRLRCKAADASAVPRKHLLLLQCARNTRYTHLHKIEAFSVQYSSHCEARSPNGRRACARIDKKCSNAMIGGVQMHDLPCCSDAKGAGPPAPPPSSCWRLHRWARRTQRRKAHVTPWPHCSITGVATRNNAATSSTARSEMSGRSPRPPAGGPHLASGWCRVEPAAKPTDRHRFDNGAPNSAPPFDLIQALPPGVGVGDGCGLRPSDQQSVANAAQTVPGRLSTPIDLHQSPPEHNALSVPLSEPSRHLTSRLEDESSAPALRDAMGWHACTSLPRWCANRNSPQIDDFQDLRACMSCRSRDWIIRHAEQVEHNLHIK